jgi:asparagine synthase (glutamine-hydrolysing)
MCGIAGICRKGSNPKELYSIVSGMCQLIKHRGPDDEGYVLIGDRSIPFAGKDTPEKVKASNFPFSPRNDALLMDCGNTSIILGHRRLAVIDLSPAGHQPFCNADGSIWLVLNGEIYNYIELRNELGALGHNFISKSDTEVLLKAYEEWGTDCLKHLNGMWSFVLYDMNKKVLWGSRDRFGVKPLYYQYSDNGFAFASEQKAFYAIPGFSPIINPGAIFDYFLMHRVENQAESFLKGIFELQPGYEFIYIPDNNSLDIHEYYSLKVTTTYEHFNPIKNEEYISETKKLIENSVRIRLRSDIPVGFCLSGGIDSSSLVSISDSMRKGGHWDQTGNLYAFSAINGSPGFDESIWARKVAQKTGCKLVEVSCTAEDLLSKLKTIIRFQDLPLLSSGTYAQYKVMEAASQHGIHLLLDGQGADELFGGYPFFIPTYYSEMGFRGDWVHLFKQLKYYPSELISIPTFMLMQAKRAMDKIIPDSISLQLAAFLRSEINFFQHPFLSDNRNNFLFAPEIFGLSLNKQLANNYSGRPLKSLLRFEDRCSMRFSVESRTPFADDLPLAEYIFSIPSIYKINNGYTKALLRSAMKGILPEETRLRRDKLGFATPLTEWMCKLNGSVQQIIAGADPNDEYVRFDRIMYKWDKIFSVEALRKNPRNAMFLWRCLNYVLWKETLIP